MTHVHGITALLARALLALPAALCACSSAPPEPARASLPVARPVPPAPAPAPVAPVQSLPHYRCERGIDFTVRYGTDSAVVDAGSRGRELLLRDAGGVTPGQTVYSNTELRAEFGLGPDGRQAVLHYATSPLEVHCALD